MKFPFTIQHEKELSSEMIQKFIEMYVSNQVYKNLNSANIYTRVNEVVKEMLNESIADFITKAVKNNINIKIGKE